MNICVYGAASDDIAPVYIRRAEELGAAIAARGHGLVFGAGAHGLMGAAARGAYAGGGRIIGIVPHFFQSEGIIFPHCTELIRTDTMRERKQRMEDRSDAFIMTPGGIGTFEEFFEILTLRQLGRHNKPIAVLNVDGYYDPLRAMMERAVTEGFLQRQCFALFGFYDDTALLLDALEQPQPAAKPFKPV